MTENWDKAELMEIARNLKKIIIFLKVSGNSLKEFAIVEAMDGLIVKEINKEGELETIFQDPTNANYTRFKTYKALRVHEEN